MYDIFCFSSKGQSSHLKRVVEIDLTNTVFKHRLEKKPITFATKTFVTNMSLVEKHIICVPGTRRGQHGLKRIGKEQRVSEMERPPSGNI